MLVTWFPWISPELHWRCSRGGLKTNFLKTHLLNQRSQKKGLLKCDSLCCIEAYIFFYITQLNNLGMLSLNSQYACK